jgi:hypothetical protein
MKILDAKAQSRKEYLEFENGETLRLFSSYSSSFVDLDS